MYDVLRICTVHAVHSIQLLILCLSLTAQSVLNVAKWKLSRKPHNDKESVQIIRITYYYYFFNPWHTQLTAHTHTHTMPIAHIEHMNELKSNVGVVRRTSTGLHTSNTNPTHIQHTPTHTHTLSCFHGIIVRRVDLLHVPCERVLSTFFSFFLFVCSFFIV